MNVNPAMLSAIWCAASDAGSIRPASADAAANTPTSSVSCIAAGNPSTTSRRIRGSSSPPGDVDQPRPRCRSRTDDDHEQRAAIDDARQHRRPGRTRNPKRRRAETAVDQHPVDDHVQQVRGDERDHDRPDHAHALQIAAEREVEQQRRQTPRHRLEIRDGSAAARPRSCPTDRGRATRTKHAKRRGDGKNQGEVDAVQQPAAALVEPPGAERLRRRADRGRAACPSRRSPTAMNSELPRPTAPIASGPSGPTMSVSTMPMVIQPSSATTTGAASANIGRNSARRSESRRRKREIVATCRRAVSNPKLQVPNPKALPDSQRPRVRLGSWELGVRLGFGIWSLGFEPARVHRQGISFWIHWMRARSL